MPIRTGGVENYNQLFLDSLQHFDTFMSERKMAHPMFWYDRVKKGTLSNYEGLTRQSNIFLGGLGAQSGLADWSAVQVSRKAAGTDPGHDACAYDPQTFQYAMETVQYSGYRSSWQSEPICVNDIRFLTEGRKQVEYIFSFMAYITQSVWDVASREWYIKTAVDNGNAFLLVDGGMDYADSPTMRFAYDPFTKDANDDTYVTFPRTANLSTLNWSFFDWWQDYLNDQCPEAGIADKSGLKVFGLMIHKRDFNRMIMRDLDLREDLRYADSRVLIEDYRSFQEFKGWAIIHDGRQARFKIVSDDGTNIKAVRVNPMKDGRAVTIGNAPAADPDYVKAELALGVVFMNDVYTHLVPSPIGNAGGGATFDTKFNYDGTFRWVNEYDRQLNPLGEVGFYFARFETFPKPLQYSNEAIVFLYLREPHTWATPQNITTHSDASDGPLSPIANAVTADVERTAPGPYTVTLTLSGKLAASVGDAVTLVDATPTTWNAVIADSSDAPKYKFVGTTAPDAYTDWTTAATVTVV